MATSDPLILLRTSLSASRQPQLTTTGDPNDAISHQTDSFSEATHLYFSNPTPQCLPLTLLTRFVSTTPDTAKVDLRSVYFAWTQKDVTITDSIAVASVIDKALPEGHKIRTLVFGERIDLITWLEGASDSSEYIKAPEGTPGTADAAAKAAEIAGGAGVPAVGGTGAAATQQTVSGRPARVIDARLQAIYNGERKMGDHNSVLRGIKPTDFSHVRKHGETFLGRRKVLGSSGRPGQTGSKPLANRSIPLPQKPLTNTTVNPKRADPIILLSPSASSLLRMTNIKSFLDQGLYVPTDHPTLSSPLVSNILHITRTLPSLSDRPMRFIIVDGPEQFKPEYWSRVVAVFTTGQTWQFRGYKWREPQELFGHVLGIFVGEKGLPIPNEVKGWGSSVKSFLVERWDERSHGAGVDQRERENRRWRDREVVEELWRTLEAHMRARAEWKR